MVSVPANAGDGTSRASLPMPLDLLKKYNAWIISNPSTVSQVESTLRSLTYLLPGARLNDSELASESIYALTNLLSLYHDSLLAKSPNTISAKGDPHSRYVKFWMNRTQLYKFLARLLKTVQYTELLWEMVGKRKGGERGRWRVVVFLESVKAIIKVCLCWLTGGRWVLSDPLPEREEIKQPEHIEEEEDMNEWLAEDADGVQQQNVNNKPLRPTRWENGVMTPPLSDSEKLPPALATGTQSQSRSRSQLSVSSTFTLPRTNISIPALPSASDISDYLSLKTLSPVSIRPPPTLVHNLSTTQSILAELIHILRPLVYAILMARLASRHVVKAPDIPSTAIGRPSWKREWIPWIVGIGMEWGSRQLMMRDVEARIPGGMRGLTEVEKDEVKKRGLGMGWWVMRGAFYETFTRNVITQTSSKLKSKPLLDLLAGVIDDYEYLWDGYYFSTS